MTTKSDFDAACERAAAYTVKHQCTAHVNAECRVVCGVPVITGFNVSDWYVDGSTVVTYHKGEPR